MIMDGGINGTYLVACCGGQVPHSCGTGHVDACVVGPLDVVDVAAVLALRCAVKEMEVIADEPNAGFPFIRLCGPLSICGVACVFRQSCCNVEECAVRDSVLIVETVVEGKDLPVESSTAGRRVPARRLCIEHGDCERQKRHLSFHVR